MWQHEISEPIGVVDEAFETEKGLFVKARLPKDDTMVSGRVIPQMRIGSVRTMSIGFKVLESTQEKVNGKTITVLTKLKLWEISPVTIPMNPAAKVTAIKAVIPFQDLPLLKNAEGEIDFKRSWDSDKAIANIREFTKSEDEPSASYKNAFLWFDKENSDLFESYKLPIADVVDNELVAIPRGIFAAAGALHGARRPVKIQPDDKKSVIKNVNKYYKKTGLESPFEKGLKSLIENIDDLSDASFFLKNYLDLSNSECTTLIQCIKRVAARNEQESRNENEDSPKRIEQLRGLQTTIESLNLNIKEKYVNVRRKR